MTDPQDFVAFWKAYPRHVGRLAAVKAYRKALQMATPEQILAGVAAYVAHKPAYADWCHPTTWLNQGRWLDEYETARSARPAVDWFDECGRLHGHRCNGRHGHAAQMAIDAGKLAQAGRDEA